MTPSGDPTRQPRPTHDPSVPRAPGGPIRWFVAAALAAATATCLWLAVRTIELTGSGDDGDLGSDDVDRLHTTLRWTVWLVGAALTAIAIWVLSLVARVRALAELGRRAVAPAAVGVIAGAVAIASEPAVWIDGIALVVSAIGTAVALLGLRRLYVLPTRAARLALFLALVTLAIAVTAVMFAVHRPPTATTSTQTLAVFAFVEVQWLALAWPLVTRTGRTIASDITWDVRTPCVDAPSVDDASSDVDLQSDEGFGAGTTDADADAENEYDHDEPERDEWDDDERDPQDDEGEWDDDERDAQVDEGEWDDTDDDWEDEWVSPSDRSLHATPYPHLYLAVDEIECGEMEHGGVAVVAVAAGQTPEGGFEVVGQQIGTALNTRFWEAFLDELKRRGLHGVTAVVSDRDRGLPTALRNKLRGAIDQRCVRRFSTELLEVTDDDDQEYLLSLLAALFAERDVDAAERRWDELRSAMAEIDDDVVAAIDAGRRNTLAFTRLPPDEWRSSRTLTPADHIVRRIRASIRDHGIPTDLDDAYQLVEDALVATEHRWHTQHIRHDT